MKLMLAIGTRPQIIKSAPLVRALSKDPEIELQLVHTGQHYDFEMSKVFFDEFDLPNPTVNLGVRSGTHACQTGKMMIKLEEIMVKLKPDFVLVPGDTNSTLASALAAVKLQLPFGHFEAGARSYDMSMPEEVNRRLSDHSSTILFAPTRNCRDNLIKEGIHEKSIHLTGDTMYDAFVQHMSIAAKNGVLERLGIERRFSVLTLHRPENVYDPHRLRCVLGAMIELEEIVTIFPAHPMTKKGLQSAGLMKLVKSANCIKLVDPVSYHEMLKLVSQAELVFTDSGGLQKESFWLHTPCITLRRNTEWIETVRLGANQLAGTETRRIVQASERLLGNQALRRRLEKLPNPFGNGRASERILRILRKSYD